MLKKIFNKSKFVQLFSTKLPGDTYKNYKNVKSGMQFKHLFLVVQWKNIKNPLYHSFSTSHKLFSVHLPFLLVEDQFIRIHLDCMQIHTFLIFYSRRRFIVCFNVKYIWVKRGNMNVQWHQTGDRLSYFLLLKMTISFWKVIANIDLHGFLKTKQETLLLLCKLSFKKHY